MSVIYVIGTGPGDNSYLTPLAWDYASRCSVLAGGKMALRHFEGLKAEKYVLEAESISTLPDLINKNLKTGDVGVLASGDPGLFSILGTILKHFDEELVEVVPGISSLQCLFARLKRTWEKAYLLSTHNKKEAAFTPRELQDISAHDTVVIFTGRSLTPSRIAQLLLNKGVDDRIATIGENLSHPNERITRGTLEQIKDINTSELCIMLLDKKPK